MIELNDLCVGYAGQAVLSHISITIRPGQVLAILGPNGCGKSTLLRTAAGLIPPLSGEISVDGAPLSSFTRREVAQRISYLSQGRSVPDITARRLVLHGRFPYLSYPRRYRPEDHEAARRALEEMDILPLADRPLSELSGGQRQRVYLAMALAQDTRTIFMDEPTTYLDVGHQLEVMAAARRLAGEGRAVALVLHDLTLALRWADRIALCQNGVVHPALPPEELFESKLLDEVFGVRLCRVQGEDGPHYYYG